MMFLTCEICTQAVTSGDHVEFTVRSEPHFVWRGGKRLLSSSRQIAVHTGKCLEAWNVLEDVRVAAGDPTAELSFGKKRVDGQG